MTALPRPLAEVRLRSVVVTRSLRGWLHWLRRPDVRARAYERTEVLLSGTARAGESRRVARQQIVERAVTYRLATHFSYVDHTRLRGAEHLAAAHARGRGVLVVGAHLAFVTGVPYVLCRSGFPVATVAGGFLKHQTTEHHRQQARIGPAMEAYGGGFIFAGTGAHAAADERIRSGGAVFIAVDMPGSLDVELLGKPAKIGQAAFRIAWDSRCPVVPAFMRRRHLTSWVEALPAIHPDDCADFETFCRRVVGAVEREMLAGAGVLAFQVSTHLWPDGSAEKAAPNRERWSRKLGGEAASLQDADAGEDD